MDGEFGVVLPVDGVWWAELCDEILWSGVVELDVGGSAVASEE